MDTFCEQIIAVRKTPLQYLAIIGYWLLALLLSGIAFLFIYYLGMIAPVLSFGFFYGAWKLSTLFNVEYEYIITNGTFDIDKITNRFSRKRVKTFELSTVSRIEKYTPAVLNSVNSKNVFFTCDKTSPDAYVIVAQKEGDEANYIVFAPNQKIRNGVIKFLPKYIANKAFE